MSMSGSPEKELLESLESQRDALAGQVDNLREELSFIRRATTLNGIRRTLLTLIGGITDNLDTPFHCKACRKETTHALELLAQIRRIVRG